MSDSVHLRNARALDARNQQQQGEIDALLVRVKHLEAQLTMVNSALQAVQQQMVVALTSRGHGPTAG